MLDFTAAALSPAHVAATNEHLIAIKAWPGFAQAPQRATLRESFAVERAIAEAEAVGGPSPPGLLRRAVKATDLRALKDEFNRRWVQGMHAGSYFLILLEAHLAGVQFTVADLRHALTRNTRRKLHPVLDIGQFKLRDIDREFRPAAALWAAHVAMEFDSTPPDIAEYLALSELIADQLLAIQMKGHGRLFDPHTPLWRVPAQLRPLLPPYSVAVQRAKPGTKLLDLLSLPM